MASELGTTERLAVPFRDERVDDDEGEAAEERGEVAVLVPDKTEARRVGVAAVDERGTGVLEGRVTGVRAAVVAVAAVAREEEVVAAVTLGLVLVAVALLCRVDEAVPDVARDVVVGLVAGLAVEVGRVVVVPVVEVALPGAVLVERTVVPVVGFVAGVGLDDGGVSVVILIKLGSDEDDEDDNDNDNESRF
jgi:hypothetical protein